MANFSIIAKLGMDDSAFGKKLSGLKTKIGGIGSKIGSVMKAGMAVAVVALTAFVAKSISAFVDFEKKIMEVRTLIPTMTDKGFDKMQKDIRELATTMGVDLLDATSALYSAISAGIPEKNAVSFLKDASKLAIAGVTDLDTAVGALTTILNSYNMKTSEADKVSDILFATMQDGRTTIGELSANLGKVVPIASALGVTFEEVGAMFATLTKGLGDGKTAEAGTMLKAMLAELGKSGSKAAEIFEKLSGSSFGNFIKNGGKVGEALQIMSKGAKESGEGLQNMFGSIEAGMGALIVAAQNGENLAKSIEKIKNGTGGVDKGFALMEKSVGRQMDKMGKSMNEIMIKIGAAFLPLINKILPLFSGWLEAMPKLFVSTGAGAKTLSTAFDFLIGAIKLAIKIGATILNTWGMWIDMFALLIGRVKGFGLVFKDMGINALSPIVEVIKGIIKSLVALATAMANPFDADKVKKAFDQIKDAGKSISESVAGWGKSFTKGFQKNKKLFDRDSKVFMDSMKVRAKGLKDIWKEEGDFAFLATKKAEEGANDLQDALQGAANIAGDMNGNLGWMAWNIKQASKTIDRELVKALARGADAGTPLAKMMADIQAKSKDIAQFWNQAAGDFAKVAGGKIELKIMGMKGGKGVEGFVRNMTKLEKELRGGAGRIAALAPEAMEKAMKAFETNGRKDALVLKTMYENAQRAQDMTLEGLGKLDSELQSILQASTEAGIPLEHLNKETKTYIDWLKARKDIAEENLEIQLKQMVNAKALADQMDELGSLLGMITDLEGKKDAKSMELLRLHKEELERVTIAVGQAVKDVKKEAQELGVNPDQVEAIEKAKQFLEDVEKTKLSDLEWLEKIYGILETMSKTLSTIAIEIPNIKPKDKEAELALFGNLSQQSTQLEVLETLEGYFVNQ